MPATMSGRPIVGILGSVGTMLVIVCGISAADSATALSPQGPPEGGCTINAVGMEFGDYDGRNPQPLDSYTTLIYVCSPIPGQGPPATALVQISTGFSPSYFPRKMSGPGGELNYNLFLDSTRQVVWGDGSGGTEFLTVDSPRPNQEVTVPVYGRIEPLQPASAGRYMDVLTVTIFF